MNALVNLRNLWKKIGKKPRPFSRALRGQPCVEELESRLVPYSVSGNAWPHPELVTISFAPDGTQLGGGIGNLFNKFNTKFGSALTWQNQILKAAQTWAQQTNLNLAVVADSGAVGGSGGYQQGDPSFGDIRIGGFNFGSSVLASAYMPPPVNNYSIAGDFNFNTGQSFNTGTTYDLYTVALHEFGHSLGLYHASSSLASMYSAYNGVDTVLNGDDISGIRNLYSLNLGRSADRYDAVASNGSFLTATPVAVNPVDLRALVPNVDITTTSDLDYYSLIAPAGTSGTMQVKIQSAGLSLLAPLVKVYGANQVEIGSVSGLNQYGTTLTVTVNGVVAGKTYYVKVDGADNTAFGTGRYALTANFSSGPSPGVLLPNTQTANGNPISGGGGVATRVDDEVVVNQTTLGTQQTDPFSARAVAMDGNGNYVVTWTSTGQDGSRFGVYARRYDVNGTPLGDEFCVSTLTNAPQQNTTTAMDADGDFVITWSRQDIWQGAASWDVYAQRYDRTGNPVGGEFRVNTTTEGEQRYSMPAMDAAGNYVVTWQSTGQDGSGSGIYAQRFDAAGNRLGGEFQVNTYTPGDQTYPSVTMHSTGSFVVTWTSNGQDGSGGGVYAQRYDAAGVAQGQEFRANSFTTDSQAYSSIAMDASGDFVVAWASDNRDRNSTDIYAQRFDSAGVAQSAEFRVNSSTTGIQTYPSVVMDGAGDFVITWSSSGQDRSGWGVYGQQFAPNGVPVEGEFLVPTTTSFNQQYTSLAMDDSGHMVVVWSGNGVGDASGVYFQRYQLSLASGIRGAVADEFDPFGHEHDDDHGAGHGEPDASASQVVSALSHSERTNSAVATPMALPVESPDEDASLTVGADVGQAPTDCPPDATSRNGAARDAVFADLDQLAELVKIH